MPELPPENTPDQPEQPTPPDGWELLCKGIIRSDFGRRRSQALDKAMMQLSAEQAWKEDKADAARGGWRRWLQGMFARPLAPQFVLGLAAVSALAVLAWFLFF